MNRMYSPSPTVRSSPIPLYLRGFPALLGQDTLDPTLFDPIYDPGIDLTPPTFPDFPSTPIILPDPNAPIIDPTIFDPTGPLVYTGPTVNPNTQAIANLYAGAVATGALTPAQAASAAAAAASAAARTAAGGGTTVGPSPRIATKPPGTSVPSFFTQQSIRGVPNWALVAAGAAALLAMARR